MLTLVSKFPAQYVVLGVAELEQELGALASAD
jgi:hypothetical protein